MLTLPLVLYMVMCEIAVGAFAVMFALDWRNQIKRNFLVLYGIIYVAFAALTYLFQQGFSGPSLLNTFTPLDKAWTGYETLPMLLFVLFMLPYNLFLWLDKNAGVDGRERAAALAQQAEDGEDAPPTTSARSRPSTLRILRLTSGSLATLAGLATIFVTAMIFRPLESANLGGAFTVAGFFAAALALGGVMTAMWLGHWYLVTPALSERPLQLATTLVLIGVFAELLLALAAGPILAPASHPTTGPSATPTAVATPAGTPAPNSTISVKPAGTPVITPLGTGAIEWLRILVSFVIPIVLGALAWKLVHDRSFQSATGMLYLIVVCVIAGEIIARGLLLIGLT
jgi:DMSO reductase anchor subunit